jgi:FMN-dependent NADH-azoreductase
MTRLLYIEASPRKARSASIEVSRAFLDAYRRAHPADEIETLDIWASDYPPFDGEAMAAKYAGLAGEALTPDQETAWQTIRQLAAPLLAADKLLLGVPMWNFGIPYRLKHLIDLITHDKLLFNFDGARFQGLMKARKAAVIYARGIGFHADGPTPASAFDFQKPYLESWLRLIGVADIESIVVEKTLFGPEVDLAGRAAAKRAAATLAAGF